MAQGFNIPVTPVVDQKALQGIEKSLQNAGRNLQQAFGSSGRRAIGGFEQPLGRITGQADEFTKSMEAANARVLAFGASVGIISAVVSGFQDLVRVTIDVQNQLIQINTLLNLGTQGLAKFQDDLFGIAKNTAQSFDTVATAALELSRQGLDGTQILTRLNDAMILSRLSGLSAADAVAGLTAAINSFNDEALNSSVILNKVAAGAANFAVSERDLIEGFKRSASVALEAGVSFDQLGGIITSLQQKTARGGSVIGNSLKTIFTRIQRIENLNALQDLGVEVTNLSGKLLPATQILENLGQTIESLNEIEQAQIAEKIGGGFQIAPLLAALRDFRSETSVATQATNVFAEATNEAFNRNVALNEALQAGIQRTIANIQQLATTIGEIGLTDQLQSFFDFFDKVFESIRGSIDSEGLGFIIGEGIVKGISGVLLGPLGIGGVLVVITTLFVKLAKFAKDSLLDFFKLNTKKERTKQIQESIFITLQKTLQSEEAIIAAEQNKVNLAEQYLRATREALNNQRAAASLANFITPIVVAGTKNPTSRAAGGFIPEVGAEKRDINRGVGGASSGDRPVVIPNFAFGGGKKGTMVANTSEYIVPNFANGGSAIFNQEMVSKYGLPDGALKISAATGYIPNFAGSRQRRSRSANETGRSIKPGSARDAVGQLLSKNPKLFDLTEDEFIDYLNKERLNIAGTKRFDLSSYGGSEQFAASTLKQNFLQAKKAGLKGGGSTPSIPLVIPADRLGIVSLFGTNRVAQPTSGKDKLDEASIRSLKNAEQISGRTFSRVELRNLQIGAFKEDSEQIRSQFDEQVLRELGPGIANIASSIFRQGFGAKGVDQNFVQRVKADVSSPKLFAPPALGQIFEASTNVAVAGGKVASIFSEGAGAKGVFDYKYDQINEKLFGLTGEKDFVDAKLTSSKGDAGSRNILDFLNKVMTDKESFSQIVIPAAKSFRLKKGSSAPRRGQAAEGYIPSFANPLNEAISRERAAGVPLSQIRINQSGKLRNSQNPQGLAVTNIRDEPTGRIPNFQQSSFAEVIRRFDELDRKAIRDANGTRLEQSNFAAAMRRFDRLDQQLANQPRQSSFAETFGRRTSLDSVNPVAASRAREVRDRQISAGQQPPQEDSRITSIRRRGAFANSSTAQFFRDKAPGKGNAQELTSAFFGLNIATTALTAAMEGQDDAASKTVKALSQLANYASTAALLFQGFSSLKGSGGLIGALSDDLGRLGGKRLGRGAKFLGKGSKTFGKSATVGQAGFVLAAAFALNSVIESQLLPSFDETSRVIDQFGATTQRTEQILSQLGGRVQQQIRGSVDDFSRGKVSTGQTALFTAGKLGGNAAAGLFSGFSRDGVQRFDNSAIVDTRTGESRNVSLRNVSAEQFDQVRKQFIETVAASTIELEQKSIPQRFRDINNEITTLREPTGNPKQDRENAARIEQLQKELPQLENRRAGLAALATQEAGDLFNSLVSSGDTSGLGSVVNEDTIRKLLEFRDQYFNNAQDSLKLFKEEEKVQEAIASISKEQTQNELQRQLDINKIRRRRPDDLDKRVEQQKILNDLTLKQQQQLRREVEAREINRATADEVEKVLREQLKNLTGIVFKEEDVALISRELSGLTDEDLNNRQKVLSVLNKQLSLSNKDERVRTQLEKISDKELASIFQRNKFLLKTLGIELDITETYENRADILKGLALDAENSINAAAFNQTSRTTANTAVIDERITRLQGIQPTNQAQSRAIDRAIGQQEIAKVRLQAEQNLADAIKSSQRALLDLARNSDLVSTKNQELLLKYAEQADSLEELNIALSKIPQLVDGASEEGEINKIIQGITQGIAKAQQENSINIAAAETNQEFRGLPPVIKSVKDLLIDFAEGLQNGINELELQNARNTDADSILSGGIESRKQQALLAISQTRALTTGDISQTEFQAAREQLELQRRSAITAAEQFDYEKQLNILGEIQGIQAQLLAGTGDEVELNERLVALKREQANLSLSEAFQRAFSSTELERGQRLTNTLVTGAENFRDTIIDGITTAIEQGGSLGDVLRSAALDFARELTKTNLRNLADFGTNALTGFLQGGGFSLYNSGGMVYGGSGARDDVPALLTGGEFIVNKDSVSKYGRKLFEDLNAGRAPTFQQGGFFAPGLFGQKDIVGKRNLLDFATQAYTTGAQDFLFSSGNASAISLEPESVRLTNFGRKRSSPLGDATRDAKSQAFDLALQQQAAELQAYIDGKNADKQLKNALIGALVTSVANFAIGGFGGAFGTDVSGAPRAIDSLVIGDNGEILDLRTLANNLGSATGSSVSSLSSVTNSLNSPAPNTGFGIGSPLSGYGLGIFDNKFYDAFFDYYQRGYFVPPASGLPGIDGSLLPPLERNSGGSVPYGMDNVPAMLSSGEYVLNSAATSRLGLSTLQNLNSGGSADSEEQTRKLLDKLDELIESESRVKPNINVTVNSNGDTQVTESNNENGDNNRRLGERIKEVVISVIEQEKRLGGSIRRGRA